jgi:flagellar biosynthesis/type III secretory pathway protein FliH
MPVLKHVPFPEAVLPEQPLTRVLRGVQAPDWQAADLSQPLAVKGVVRGACATVAPRPFELAVLDPTPDFALPPVEEPGPVSEEVEPEVLYEDPEQQRAWQETEAQVRLAEETARAREEGWQAGYAQARAETNQQVEACREALDVARGTLHTAWTTALHQMEPVVTHLAFAIAEAILEAPLPASLRTLSTQQLTTTIELLALAPPVQVRLHPVDLLRLQEAAVIEPLMAAFPDLQWETNADLKPGEWVVQTPTALVRRLHLELLAHLRQHLMLPDLE